MPLIFQEIISESDLINNPNVYYIFGDNEERKGFGGLAKICRNKSNSIGIATKKFPGNNYDDFWYDSDFDRIKKILDEDFKIVYKLLDEKKVVVISSAGIGTGLSRLQETAPKVLNYINEILEGFFHCY